MADARVPIALIVGGSAAALGGVAAGTVGGAQIRSSVRRIRRHTALHEARYSAHLEAVERTNEALRVFGRTQERAQRDVIHRMRDFLVRHAKQVRAHEHLILDGVDGASGHITSLAKIDPDIAGWVRGVVGAAGAGVATPAALGAAVIKYANASTGTPIAELSGAAAEKARLAFLGGGSLSTGGGGIKLGRTATSIATVGPAILIAGVAVKNQGTKARTEAAKHETETSIAIAALDARDELMRGVQNRARELDRILQPMIARAVEALDALEADPFDIAIQAELLQVALVLVKSVREVATAPVADEDGSILVGTEELILKYRDASKESNDGE